MTTKKNAVLISNLFTHFMGEYVVISPGSRNAPLIKSFLETDGVTCLSVVDERCAAFFALGISITTNKPVALVCTSGTALLNYSPAIAEAYYLGIPLIVLSADRPFGRIDKGEGQSIQQQNVFRNFQKGFMNITEMDIMEKVVVGKSEKLFLSALSGKNGPIHFNLPFSEPLYQESSTKIEFRFKTLKSKIRLEDQSVILDNSFLEKWRSSNRIIVLCGKLTSSKELLADLEKLSIDERVIILYESISNLKLESGITTIDRTLSASNLTSLAPDLVITIGEHIVSKRIKQFLKDVNNLEHWHICDDGKELDTFECKSLSIKMLPENFVTNLLNNSVLKNSDYSKTWKSNELKGRNLHNKFLSQVSFSDVQVFDIVLSEIPSYFHLQSGNSSIIRYIQLFDYNQWENCHANRGTSGIDGSTSTAVGYSFATKEPTLLITGDVSFLYDSNGLWNDSIRSDFRIIVVNNGGGGIFRFIPGPQTIPDHEKFFETTHNVDIQHLANAYEFEFDRAENKDQLCASLKTFFKPSKRPKILEIRTPRKLNAEILKDYFSFIEKNK